MLSKDDVNKLKESIESGIKALEYLEAVSEHDSDWSSCPWCYEGGWGGPDPHRNDCLRENALKNLKSSLKILEE